MNPLISVIVPVYNVEDYLDRCVESIVNQTYKNLEIILVDDGSPDNCPQICDDWAKKDSRIIVIHMKNGGQASARNEGLRIATGELIGFVDSDDYIDKTMYELMYECLRENNSDIVECTKMDFDDNQKFDYVGSNQVLVFNRKEAIEDFLKETHLKCTVWNMLCKAEIAKCIMFDDGKTHEDILWPYRVYMKADRIVYLDKALYYYYQRPGSTMNKAYSEKRFDGLDALEQRAKLVKLDYPEYYSLATRSYLGACKYQYQYLCRQPNSKELENYKRIIYSRFISGDKKALYDGLSIKYKLWFSMFSIAPNLTSNIRNRLKIGL